MINALTVDVEDWYHTNGLNIAKKDWRDLQSTVYPNTMKILDLFDELGVKATFFILGDVAKRFPRLVREIVTRGHEIGSHGMNHQLVSGQSIEEFKKDFKQSIAILEKIAKQKIKFYRAPSWSISEDRLEILSYLEKNGIICDSSLQPFKTPLSGINGIPTRPFKPIITGQKLDLVEFPPTIMRLHKHFSVPFAGGFYLRLFPWKVISKLLRIINKTRPGMVYIHPWELDSSIPRFKTSWLIQIIQYHRLHSTERTLRNLIHEFEFAPLGQVIKNQQNLHEAI
ncbi:polysaccharide deacetylase family protein [Paenisporosarcina indica]|uniref:polysaccharide deacetylase family protein n=1 Tax=Paenisporosarcina indica TaxID=650093 RepID=UPI0009500647|nr:polysaccharide deacetylase family protein [Paenisporosarcina indica]